ncbi:MAG: NAD(P)/FAD-dependent oxidoreductase [Candidatus Pedobacter colombiensis]|uniref:Flavin-dependent monooxygenase n=1 Tax=Candidatus Pedobacter colombiensis TaxID=3121371 RepID=A0AAJ5WCH5_9SPHI|nr:NAD(P)/FAD-dependent oxidoreductase [Pedobacter sp.]WEK21040.1 MAG: NAD(P)/FAD-dependent oxidoreductase [Pedobacter sp.]
MLIQNIKIAIVGGGPGGLTLARLLQMNGAAVKVYERDLDKNTRVQGATLDLHDDSGLKALEKAGLMDAFKSNYRPGADKMCIVDHHAHVFFDERTTNQEEATFGSPYFRPEIDRGPLRKILLDTLDPDTVVWNSQFKTMRHTGNTWTLDFQNGTSAVADLVIAADGANSKIRPLITPIKPFYSGVTAIEGNIYDAERKIPRICDLLKDGKIFGFGTGKTIIVSSKGDGSVAFYAGFRAAEHWASQSELDFSDKASILNWFKCEFAEWNNIWQELFENAETPFMPRPLYCIPLDQNWDALSNLTMLGDAAHLMPPYAGEGVNMAMLDALELAEHLIDPQYKTLQAAIANYENQMRIRSAQAAEGSLDNTLWMHDDNAIARMMAMFEAPL